MSYIVAWSDIEKPKKRKKNALFILPPIQHDRYELYKRKRDAERRYKNLLGTNCVAVLWGKVEQLTIQK